MLVPTFSQVKGMYPTKSRRWCSMRMLMAKWAAGNITPREAQQNGFQFDLALETNHVWSLMVGKSVEHICPVCRM
jgi:hypothetical protein